MFTSFADGSYGKYEVKRNGIYDPYYLVIRGLQYTDRGSYYCCLPSNCSYTVDDNCQRFVLRIRGKEKVVSLFVCFQGKYLFNFKSLLFIFEELIQ